MTLPPEVPFDFTGIGLVARGEKKDGEVWLGVVDLVGAPGEAGVQAGVGAGGGGGGEGWGEEEGLGWREKEEEEEEKKKGRRQHFWEWGRRGTGALSSSRHGCCWRDCVVVRGVWK